MNRLVLGAAVGATALVASLVATTTATAAPGASAAAHRSARVCAPAAAGYAACAARVVVDSTGKPAVSATPRGYGPVDIEAAYGLPAAGTATPTGPTVAIVDAYNDPTAEADLAVYRKQFGLPACTTSNGCFRKVSQTGSTTALPKTDAGWATEISLDLDMVSAACPNCKILLVEASSASFANLGTAVNYAASVTGVAAISNSYGGSDTAQSSIPGYDHKGIAITASTGDAGYGVESPASFPTVIAVGGTSLTKSGTAYAETAWSGAGSGCSTLNATPAWQAGTSCNGKANADVSAVADPNTGVAVYDSTRYQGRSGWQVYGGTSASSPIIGSVYALGGNHGYNYPGQYTWTTTGGLHDVTTGSNGNCSPSVWCTAGSGWDGPTGLGTPNGTSRF
jgi:subtilase family serine protease